MDSPLYTPNASSFVDSSTEALIELRDRLRSVGVEITTANNYQGPQKSIFGVELEPVTRFNVGVKLILAKDLSGGEVTPV